MLNDHMCTPASASLPCVRCGALWSNRCPAAIRINARGISFSNRPYSPSTIRSINALPLLSGCRNSAVTNVTATNTSGIINAPTVHVVSNGCTSKRPTIAPICLQNQFVWNHQTDRFMKHKTVTWCCADCQMQCIERQLDNVVWWSEQYSSRMHCHWSWLQ